MTESSPNVKQVLNLQGGLGQIKGLSLTQISITPASVAANTTVEQTFTVQGLQSGDFVDVTPPGITAGIGIGACRCGALGVLTIQFSNNTAGALTPPSGVYALLTVR